MLHLHVCWPVWPILVNGVSQSQRPLQRGVKLKPASKLKDITPPSPKVLHNHLILYCQCAFGFGENLKYANEATIP